MRRSGRCWTAPDGPQFAAPDGIRPGQVGTVVDETADVVDITATLLDLAVRNYLTIVELPRESAVRQAGLGAAAAERRAARSCCRTRRHCWTRSSPTATRCVVSDLGPSLRPRLNLVREQLYADVVTQGWFASRPDAVRNRWTTAGVVLLGAGASC